MRFPARFSVSNERGKKLRWPVIRFLSRISESRCSIVLNVSLAIVPLKRVSRSETLTRFFNLLKHDGTVPLIRLCPVDSRKTSRFEASAILGLKVPASSGMSSVTEISAGARHIEGGSVPEMRDFSKTSIVSPCTSRDRRKDMLPSEGGSVPLMRAPLITLQRRRRRRRRRKATLVSETRVERWDMQAMIASTGEPRSAAAVRSRTYCVLVSRTFRL